MKRLGYIAFWNGGYPVTDGQDVILFPTYEDASTCAAGDKTKGAVREVEKVYGVVRRHKEQAS